MSHADGSSLDGGSAAGGKTQMKMEELNTGGIKSHGPVGSEEELLVDKKHRVSLKTAVYLKLAVVVVCWVTVVYLGIMGIITLVLGILLKSSACFAFALSAILDCLSSVVVLWRYSGSAATLYSAKREQLACTILGCLFIISAISITARASIAIADTIKPEHSVLIMVLFIINAVVCFAFVVVKSYLARKLESISIATDAVNSGIGFTLALSVLLSDVVYAKNHRVWYIDPIVGCVCSVFLAAYGIWLIVYEQCVHKPADKAPEVT